MPGQARPSRIFGNIDPQQDSVGQTPRRRPRESSPEEQRSDGNGANPRNCLRRHSLLSREVVSRAETAVTIRATVGAAAGLLAAFLAGCGPLRLPPPSAPVTTSPI